MQVHPAHTQHALFFSLHFIKHSTHNKAFQTSAAVLNNICFTVCTVARWATVQDTTNTWPELQCSNMTWIQSC